MYAAQHQQERHKRPPARKEALAVNVELLLLALFCDPATSSSLDWLAGSPIRGVQPHLVAPAMSWPFMIDQHWHALAAFQVTGVVNMCDEFAGPVDEYKKYGIQQLYLPTGVYADVCGGRGEVTCLAVVHALRVVCSTTLCSVSSVWRLSHARRTVQSVPQRYAEGIVRIDLFWHTHTHTRARPDTVDHMEPTLENIKKAVAFIQEHYEKKEGVYIHCKGVFALHALPVFPCRPLRPRDELHVLQAQRFLAAIAASRPSVPSAQLCIAVLTIMHMHADMRRRRSRAERRSGVCVAADAQEDGFALYASLHQRVSE